MIFTFLVSMTDGTKACVLWIIEPYLSNLVFNPLSDGQGMEDIYFASNNQRVLMLMH